MHICIIENKTHFNCMNEYRVFSLDEIARLTHARVVCGSTMGHFVESAFSADLMSDVLTLSTNKMLLITGMANLQTIRTAEMADIHCILFVRKKKATPEMIALANELHMILLESNYSLFKTSGILFCQGLKPVY
jgi:predicted transcriptional regulator